MKTFFSIEHYLYEVFFFIFQEHDSKWGIQKCFAEGTNELNKVQEWYVKVSRPWVKDDIKVTTLKN